MKNWIKQKNNTMCIPCLQILTYFVRMLMEKRMPSQHKEGSRNEKREMKETADPKSQGSGYFWSGRGWVMIGERGGGRAVFWFLL